MHFSLLMPLGGTFRDNLVYFSDNWHDSAGNTYDLDTTEVKSITGNVTLTILFLMILRMATACAFYQNTATLRFT